ncbi:MAG: DinB family protein [Acidobacteria bacterium]|nr:DinB family protein [Acidobacteriota bacterium]MBI3423247.1 DinB family protein [Acidobacteriota bacterium]
MNKAALQGQRFYFNMVHGVTLRLIGTFSDADLDFRPKEGLRSVRELIMHMYTMERSLAANIRSGKLTEESESMAVPEKPAGQAVLAELKTVADLLAYARRYHQALDETAEAMTDEDLQKPVEAWYGSFPAWQFFAFAYDEHWHHRGQLYTYARLLGKEPPMLYDYENSPV